MYKTLLFIIWNIYFLNGQLLSGHNRLLEHLRKSGDSLNISSVKTIWVQQPVDHFNATDNRVWKMKILKNLNKWRQGGPVYIFIGGEGPTDECFLISGIVYELAEETNGAMFATEHRYYGDDKPFDNVSRDNLRFLSSSQALADIAKFIKELKQSKDFMASKIVAVGGSYAGNLAAWMRLHYPEIVDAAISSSAPVLAQLDFPEFYETVGNVFRKYATPDCFAGINNLMAKTKRLLTNNEGIEELKHICDICEDNDLTKTINQAGFFYDLLSVYGSAAQHGTPEDIQKFCDRHKANYIQKLNDRNCNDVDFDNFFNNHTSLNNLIFKWWWQTCTEFGYGMTAPQNLPFAGVTLDVNYYIKICSRLFGSQFDEKKIVNATQNTNNINGGLKPNLTNVIFVHGEIDPWHRLGITKDLSELAPARIIPGASHCNDLYSDSEISEEVKKVKREEKDFIKRCIGL